MNKEDQDKLNMYHEAQELSREVHSKQKRRDGQAYLSHILRVEQHFNALEEKIVALLHDTLEDSNMTWEDLITYYGFTLEIAKAVEAISRRKGEDYFTYIERVKKNKLARAVKQADLKDNMNLYNFETITMKDINRTTKYATAMMMLKGGD
jgi:(p)ppGpp synthase/HD superfamily hydrolase